MSIQPTRRLLDYFLPPEHGFALESLISTTYQVDFDFFEEELLPAALGISSPISRMKAFRSELERKLQRTDVTVLYDLAGSEKVTRLSPRIDAIPVSARKLHSKISLLTWVREKASPTRAERRMRLLVGSANLTKSGFRHNYECVAPFDFGGNASSPPDVLTKAISLVRQIADGIEAPQLRRQLAALSSESSLLPKQPAQYTNTLALITADEVLTTIREAWARVSDKPPEAVSIVSPFWPQGATALAALQTLYESLGSPRQLEFICPGERSADGKAWLPIFDSNLALGLKKAISGDLFLRPALPETGPGESSGEAGDELEEERLAVRLQETVQNQTATEIQRPLHAKMIVLDGMKGSVLYVGSSNCTRKGLALGGPPNHEAGFVYQLTPRERRHIAGLLAFAGPASQVRSDQPPMTVQPVPTEEVCVPRFLAEITAKESIVTLRFQYVIPSDLVVLMPIPSKAYGAGFWLLYRAEENAPAKAETIIADLSVCGRCDDRLQPIDAEMNSQPLLPHVYVEVRWEGHAAIFPVRFDDKTRLPLFLRRRVTEGELIDYYLYGRQPDDWDETKGFPGMAREEGEADLPIDTRRILAYFMRRFVQAIPGIEAEVKHSAYSRTALDASLRGPTSPLELAERAYASLTTAPAKDEPKKTPTAVAFQLTEILSALGRTQKEVSDDLQDCFEPIFSRCHELLDTVVSKYPELQQQPFRRYKSHLLGK
jgi:hypothetical protein